MTPFTKKPTITQLFFTYVIPLIPISYAWDGQASLPRMYAFDDIRQLIGDRINDPEYRWEISQAFSETGKKLGYYVLGYPTKVVKK